MAAGHLPDAVNYRQGPLLYGRGSDRPAILCRAATGGMLGGVISTVEAIWEQRCPRCRDGRIFRASLWRGFLAMHDVCPVCGLKFDREPGYFLGAMYFSYLISLLPVL